MPESCPECKQPYELEPGFWYGTAYVSYALSVALSVTTFVAWYVLIGMSTTDNRFSSGWASTYSSLFFYSPGSCASAGSSTCTFLYNMILIIRARPQKKYPTITYYQ
ncbi:hypothetical protein [Paraflavitalea speifideaquila]|uniref:hypothetical protein n=1 Tax=Paraflavitalea speifideaquila TaxID=3076558 RepID=UPI0028ECEE44|nr:hypothetical protein [Paraflavitalea speifideiaquila]